MIVKQPALLLCVLLLASVAHGQMGDALTKKVSDILGKLPAGTTHRHVELALRDGVTLATEVFILPGDGPRPTMLLRTPYPRWDLRPLGALGWRGSRRGGYKAGGPPCVLVLQNCRGRFGSGGKGTHEPFSFDNEINDSDDTIKWIANQKWSNGRVGM